MRQAWDDDDVALLFSRREAPLQRLAEDADSVAAACHAMAGRFHRGGKLLVFGVGACCSDALHVAVEFVHPVIVGKRALPALALTTDVATLTGVAASDGLADVFAHQMRLLGQAPDIALGICADDPDDAVRNGLAAARELGMLTLCLAGGDGTRADPRQAADHVLLARSTDPRVVKEVHVTIYHLLWELVHVFFEQPGALAAEAVA